jgi:hypothetical protein
MGQFFYVVNLDKREYLEPHALNNMAKLMEFGSSGHGTMLGLAILLANSNGRGNGDCRSKSPIIGSWAGDRVVIAGEYANERDACEPSNHDRDGNEKEGEYKNIYTQCKENKYKNISALVMGALKEDEELC